MTRILLFILIGLSISSFRAGAQDTKEEWRYEGPRFGLDLSRFVMTAFQPADRWGWEVQADYPYKGNFFPTVEAGMMWLDDERENFHYESDGMYGRVGLDMNILKFDGLSDNDVLTLGFRYGYSRFNQSASDINYSNFWGNWDSSIPEEKMSAHWGELVFGMKGEVFRNFFIGWSLRIKFLLSQTQSEELDPYIIPGLGKNTIDFPVDFSYGIYYRLPWKKTKKMPKVIKMGGAKNYDADQDNSDPYNNNNNQNGNYSRQPGNF